jgi:hypothetical protein
MKMQRHFLVSDDLDDLEHLEEELEAQGVSTPQIHVFTLDDTEAEKHVHLHVVQSIMKRDVVNSMIIGAILGAVLSISVLGLTALLEWHKTAAGWIPFIFLAIIILGFCTWEGGFVGIQTLNRHFKQFKATLEQGKHVFYCDLAPNQVPIFQRVVQAHPKATMAGTGVSTPPWIMSWQTRLARFFGETMP